MNMLGTGYNSELRKIRELLERYYEQRLTEYEDEPQKPTKNKPQLRLVWGNPALKC